ncbi:PREDICTED: vitellogenin receptor-like, partial [Wasmannia auropunctata]|uniref:vitellogenin receptor-like n=1 Tax=Wasmannia auropunctata TaxID=64793 RepID=UPI0005EECCE8
MTIDYPNDRLYWVDAKLKIIESIRLDGTDRRLVLHDIIQQPFSLAIFENKLYWSDEESKTIESCNKFTGKDWQTLYRINEEHQPYSVHIDHSAIKPKINNPCHFNPCSELCMLNQDKGYTCACTMDKELSADNHSCRDVKQNKHLLVVARRGFMFGNMGNMFITYYHQMLGKPKLITNTTMQSTLLPARAFITDVTSDPTSGEVIISYKTSETEILVRYDPVGNNFRKIMSIDSTNFQGIAFDYIGNNLYMTNAHNNTIMVRNMKTEAMTEFYFKDLTPQYVTLVPEESKMYVVFQRNYHFSTNGYVLYEMNMNGLGERKLIRDNMTARIAMCYDRDSKTLFVSEELAGRILSYSVAEGIRILGTGLKPASLAVAGDNI